MKPLFVYLAGPMRGVDADGNPDGYEHMEENVHRGIDDGIELLQRKYVVIIPHLNYYADPHGNKLTVHEWMLYEKHLLSVCDALIRMPGASHGADQEVAWAHELNIPVFYGVPTFLAMFGDGMIEHVKPKAKEPQNTLTQELDHVFEIRKDNKVLARLNNDGTMFFGTEPEAAAKVFWDGVVQNFLDTRVPTVEEMVTALNNKGYAMVKLGQDRLAHQCRHGVPIDDADVVCPRCYKGRET